MPFRIVFHIISIMAWWNGRKPDPALAKRLDELTRRFDRLEERWNRIDVEWSEWYDKYRRLYARLAKREQLDRQRDTDGNADHPNNTPPEVNPLAARLLGGSPLLRRGDE